MPNHAIHTAVARGAGLAAAWRKSIRFLASFSDPRRDPDSAALADLERLAETAPHLLDDIGMCALRRPGEAPVWAAGRYRVRVSDGAPAPRAKARIVRAG